MKSARRLLFDHPGQLAFPFHWGVWLGCVALIALGTVAPAAPGGDAPSKTLTGSSSTDRQMVAFPSTDPSRPPPWSATGAPTAEATFSIGISQRAFSEVNENDATAAFRVLSNQLGKKLGYNMRTVVHMYGTNEEFARAIRSGEVAMVICNTWDYLAMQIEDVSDIAFTAVNGGSSTHRWLLLVRADSGIHSLTDLRGRKVIGLNHNLALLGWQWAADLLREQNLGDAYKFFGASASAVKPSSTVLPVFFGQAAACIVDDAAFETMSELNPQIGRQLVPIATSEPLLNSILCLNRAGWESPQARDDAQKALGELDRQPAGRQILNLFRAERLEPFQPKQIEAIRRLYERAPKPKTNPQP